ncbi:MAG: type II secretion system protein [Fidelibacterota bacterium]
MKRYVSNTGFTLVELVMVIVIIAILSAVGFRSLSRISENRNFNITIDNMNKIKYAIVGNPKIVENGVRLDYGYVGDTGQFPTSLSDLITDPGVTGWDGPYGDYIGIKEDPTALFRDGWNATIAYSVPASGPVTLTSPGGGEPIVLNIANDKSEILNNTVALRVRNKDGYPLRDSDATVQIKYGGSPWQTMTYSTTVGYNISSVPIGIATLRFIIAGDTSLRHLSVGPNNSTTSPTEGLEYTVNPTFGTLTYVAGSASLGGTNNSELTFTVNNSGNTIMEIDQISVSWSNSLCWECDYAYMANITVNGGVYWKWNTYNRSALASTGARLVLDSPLSLSSGNTTIGPIAFQDLVDGSGSPQPMNDVTFQISFFSSLTPNQTVSFSTGGTCAPAVISYSNLSKPQLYQLRCRINNTGDAATTITGIKIKCDVTPSPYLNIISFINASTIYWRANQSWCGNQSRQLVDNVNGVDITFCKTQPPAFVPGGSYILLNRMDFYLNATGNTKANITGGNFTLTLHFLCGSDQTISFTMP